jgi:2-hydroxychromene-2-carboxylate isomerase
MATLTLYYDIVCPYAYLGFSQAEAFARRHGVALVLRPILLGGVFKAIEAPQEPARAMSWSKARLNALDLLRQADLLGVPVAWHPRHPVRTVRAMRLLVGCDDPSRAALTAALYRAYWVEHRDLADPAVVDGVARAHGVDPGVADTPEARDALFAATAEAVALGGFGVPIWRLTDPAGLDRFWWGADRLPLVAAALGGEHAAPSPLPRSAVPLTITFFHDFSSPFSYLASRRIGALADAEGAALTWAPILVGALFNEIGTPNVPLLAMPPAKARYIGRDMVEQAAHAGIPFRMPSAFPLRTVLPLRVAIVAPEATQAIYAAAWAEDRDVGRPEVLRGVLDGAGLDGGALIAAAEDPAVKAALRDNTARAAAVGACGVPTFAVGEQVFWGQDRLEQVRQAVRGWRGPAGA